MLGQHNCAVGEGELQRLSQHLQCSGQGQTSVTVSLAAYGYNHSTGGTRTLCMQLCFFMLFIIYKLFLPLIALPTLLLLCVLAAAKSVCGIIVFSPENVMGRVQGDGWLEQTSLIAVIELKLSSII